MMMLNQCRMPLHICLLGFSLLAMGCGGGTEKVNLASVTGRITDGGKPIEGAIVEFFPTDGRTSVAVTDGAGNYNLRYSDEFGAVVGEGKFQITPESAPIAAGGDGDVVAPPMEGPPKIIRISDIFTIKEDEENQYDFDLSKYSK